MTRRDFELIAATLKATTSRLISVDRFAICATFASELATTNRGFNRDRFLEACGIDAIERGWIEEASRNGVFYRANYNAQNDDRLAARKYGKPLDDLIGESRAIVGPNYKRM